MLARVLPSDATFREVTWAVYGEDGGATLVASISPDGRLTALQNGTVRVVATAIDGSGQSREILVAIRNQP